MPQRYNNQDSVGFAQGCTYRLMEQQRKLKQTFKNIWTFKYIYIQSSHKDIFSLILEREREGERKQYPCERETLIGFLLNAPCNWGLNLQPRYVP